MIYQGASLRFFVPQKNDCIRLRYKIVLDISKTVFAEVEFSIYL
jgi:hypothetical protein